MRSQIGMLKWVGLGLFFLISASVTGYEWLYGIPHRKCDSAKAWWSDKYRRCFTPLPIVTLTGKPAAKVPEAKVSETKASETGAKK